MIPKVGNGTTQTFCGLFATTNFHTVSHWTLCSHDVGSCIIKSISETYVQTHMYVVLIDLKPMILFTDQCHHLNNV